MANFFAGLLFFTILCLLSSTKITGAWVASVHFHYIEAMASLQSGIE